MGEYDDIINLPHYEPKNHPRMSMWKRAAQFAPFAALTGYEHSRVRNLCARGFKTLTEPIFNDEAYLVPVLLCSKLLKTKIN